jgi:hypothetical protein
MISGLLLKYFPQGVRNMNRKASFWFAVVVIAVSVPALFAQVKVADKYLITARAGGVNEVAGEVSVERVDGRVNRLLKGDEVQIGEKVATGTDSRAEILMNPGSYIRLGADSSFEFVSTDLDDVRLKMHKGSAILEVFGTEGFYVDLSANTARFTILDTGVYRIYASPNGTSTVAVWRGKLRAGTDKKNTFGSGKIVTFDGRTYSVAKFDRDDKDALAIWSKDRSKELSRIASSLTRDSLRDPLISSFYGGRWSLYDSFGLWVYNRSFGSYCFLPFGWGWYSPYGYGYGRWIGYYNLPVAVYRQPPPSPSETKMPQRARPSEPGRVVVTDGSSRADRVSPDLFKNVRRDQSNIRRDPPSEPRYSPPRSEPVFIPTPVAPAPETKTRRP